MSQETYLGTMTFEFHIVFMCHEILIFFLHFFQPLQLVRLFLARGRHGNWRVSGFVPRPQCAGRLRAAAAGTACR